MKLLLQVYPGDAGAFFAATVFVEVTAVILAAWLLARLRGRWNAAWRHSVYVIALASVLACPALPWMMHATGATSATVRQHIPAAASNGVSTDPSPLSDRVPARDLAESPPPPVSIGLHSDARNLAQVSDGDTPPAASAAISDILRATGGGTVAIWLLGMALLLARWCHGLRLVAALRRRARPLDTAATEDLLDRVRRALGSGRLPALATSAGVDRPLMVGLVRPLVILPEEALQTLGESELTDVLVHECAHSVCRHQFIGLLQRLAATIFWPHPLVHFLNRSLARAREEVCDNYVLRGSDSRRYARTLLELSQLLVDLSPKPATLGLFHCRWRLEARVADLLDRRRRTMVRVSRWNIAVLALGFLSVALPIAGIRVATAQSTPQMGVPQSSVYAARTVPFAIGPHAFAKGDEIKIAEVWSKLGTLDEGDTVTVTGTYKLASRPAATLSFYITVDAAKGSHGGPDNGVSLHVQAGTASFKLERPITEEGHLHLGFYPDQSGGCFGTVYFGTSAQMKEIAHWDVRKWTSEEGGGGRTRTGSAVEVETAGSAALQLSPDQSSPAADDRAAENAEIRQSAGNLREIMSAIHLYGEVAGHLPAATNGWGYDSKNKEWFRQRPNVSWRVLLLPFMGEKELFAKFRIDEPWDSENNRKLIPMMPRVYRAPGSRAGAGKTNYLGVVGANAAFPETGNIMIQDFTDGTVNTIMLVEVPDEAAVEWTRPDDFPVDTKDPIERLVGLRRGGFLTAFADGAPQFISESIAPKTLQRLLIRNDGEPVDLKPSVRFVPPAAGSAVQPNR